MEVGGAERGWAEVGGGHGGEDLPRATSAEANVNAMALRVGLQFARSFLRRREAPRGYMLCGGKG